ncbi:MAG: hypothetical protein ACI845_003609 [Gammaproteobacteria bacterium]|jgi:uncharacterized protein (DUF2132 family)
MTKEINYENNPLNGVGLKELLTELVDHYGFEILFAYLNINCFYNNPSIDSSAKFLKKTIWAREKIEAFYLYQFKNLPNVSSEQFSVPPRNRVIADDQKPGNPAELSFEDAERLREKREVKSAAWELERGHRSGSNKGFSYKTDNRQSYPTAEEDRESTSPETEPTPVKDDPWANWKNKPDS